MDISIKFEEILKYVDTHFGQKVKLSFVSDKEITVAIVKHILIKEVTIGINLIVNSVNNDKIGLSYKGTGIDLIIKGALNFIAPHFPEFNQAIELQENNNLIIDLKKIDKLEPALKQISLTSISFSPSSVNIGCDLK